MTLLAVLILAATLIPFHQMKSTCPMYNLTGVPCPFCKMTTAWSLFLRGNVMTGLAVNPMGVAFLLVTIGGIFYLALALIMRYEGFPITTWTKKHRWPVRIFFLLWLINWIYVIAVSYTHLRAHET